MDMEPVRLPSKYRNEYADDYRYLAMTEDVYGRPISVYGKTQVIAVTKLMDKFQASIVLKELHDNNRLK